MGSDRLSSPEKILILYASAGHGHAKAAQSILEACREHCGDAAVESKDTIALASGYFGTFYRELYFFLITRVPWLWGFFYYVMDHPWIYAFVKPLRRALNAATARGLERYLLDANPTRVIATHFQSAEVVSHLRRSGKLQTALVTVVTDYLPHRIWVADEADAYAVALPETKTELERRGVAPERIRAVGIPVEKKFLAPSARSEIRERLGFSAADFVVLVTGGGIGAGSIGPVVQHLVRLGGKVRVVAVCGTNRALFGRLEVLARTEPRLMVFGFVNNMHELMDAADLLIGKGGGLTVTEAIARRVPLVLYRSIPGQEARNARIVAHYRAGFVARSLPGLRTLVAELADDARRLERAREGLGRMFGPEAAVQVAMMVRR